MKLASLLSIILIHGLSQIIYAQNADTNASNVDSIVITQADFPAKKAPLDTISGDSVSNGYFKWKVTGDLLTDQLNMEIATQKFKHDFSEIYSITAFDTSAVFFVPLEEFNVMPIEKQKLLTTNPKKYIIVRESNMKEP